MALRRADHVRLASETKGLVVNQCLASLSQMGLPFASRSACHFHVSKPLEHRSDQIAQTTVSVLPAALNRSTVHILLPLL